MNGLEKLNIEYLFSAKFRSHDRKKRLFIVFP